MDTPYLKELTCPICGRNFIPAPLHGWYIHDQKHNKVFLCRYNCMRKAEKNSKYITPKTFIAGRKSGDTNDSQT